MNPRRLAAAAAALALLAGFAGCAKKDGVSGSADSTASDGSGIVRFERAYGATGDSLAGSARYVLVTPQPERVPGVSALAESLRAAIAWAAAEGQAGPDGRPLPVDSVATRFVANYQAFRAQFNDVHQEWSVDRAVALEILPFGLSTLKIDDVRYEGGAHGMANTFYQSFDPASGARLRLGDIADRAGLDSLRLLGEAAFRAERGVSADSTLESANFFVWDDTGFLLSENFGVMRSGLVFHYNAYDVAPYASGPTTITLPWAAVSRFVRADGPLKMAK